MYRDLILATLHDRRHDPRHVEAYMRLEHPTLDGLSRGRFAAEVEIAVECIDQGGADVAEELACSFNL